MNKETTKKEFMKIYGVRIGSVNVELLEKYRKHIQETSIHRTVRSIVEKRILGYKIKSEGDVNNAIEYASNLFYNSLCEAVEDIARSDMMNQFEICKNCSYYDGKGLNGKCSKIDNMKIGAYSHSCIHADFK